MSSESRIHIFWLCVVVFLLLGRCSGGHRDEVYGQAVDLQKQATRIQNLSEGLMGEAEASKSEAIKKLVDQIYDEAEEMVTNAEQVAESLAPGDEDGYSSYSPFN